MLACLYAMFTGVVFVEPSPAEVIFVFFVLSFLLLYGIPSVSLIFLVLSFLFFIFNLTLVFRNENSEFGFFTTGVRLYLLLVSVFLSVFLASLDEYRLQLFLKFLIAGALINSVFIFLAIFTKHPILDFVYRDEYKLRLKGLFEDPNVMGPHLVFCYSLLLFYFRSHLFLLLALVIAATVALSYSRASWAGVFFVPGIYLLLRYTSGYLAVKWSKVLPVVFIITLISSLSIIYLVETNSEFIDYFSKRASLQDYDNDRFEGQEFALGLFLDSPLGYGPGSTVKRLGGIMPHNDPHNVYLKLLVEVGFLGGGIFILLLLYISFKLFLSVRSGSVLATILLANMVYIIALGFIIDTTHWRILYLIIALSLALNVSHFDKVYVVEDGNK